MPISEVNNLPDSPMSLISPARFLLPAYMNSFGEQSILMSPPASALPQPNLLDTGNIKIIYYHFLIHQLFIFRILI